MAVLSMESELYSSFEKEETCVTPVVFCDQMTYGSRLNLRAPLSSQGRTNAMSYNRAVLKT
jgi:hypothetical protein